MTTATQVRPVTTAPPELAPSLGLGAQVAAIIDLALAEDVGRGGELDARGRLDPPLDAAEHDDLVRRDPAPDDGLRPHRETAPCMDVPVHLALDREVAAAEDDALEAPILGHQGKRLGIRPGLRDVRHAQPPRIRLVTRWRSSGPK